MMITANCLLCYINEQTVNFNYLQDKILLPFAASKNNSLEL